MDKGKIALIAVAIAAGFAASFLGGIYVAREEGGSWFFGESDLLSTGAVPAIDFDPFWKSWRIIEEEYVFSDKPTEEERLWGAISGLVGSIGDPYSVFLPPEEAETFEEDISGNFEGVGMEIAFKDDILTVVAPLRGTPAEKAGILAGDKIIMIDGVETGALSINEAVRKIRGSAGTSVHFSIFRDGKKLEFDVSRQKIEIPTLETEIKDGVFILTLHHFSGNSPSLFREALREFVFSHSKKLVIDLRNNPGGFLEAAIDLTSWFIPAGEPIVRENLGEGKEERAHRSRGYDIFDDDVKIVVLVNQGSASASEIMAGALSEYGKATLIGEKTFGKASVQELISVTDNTFIKLTVAKWLTPKGVSISTDGLTPDIAVSMTEKDIVEKRDPQLERAITFLNEGR